jgi:extradiol dioxygenase
VRRTFGLDRPLLDITLAIPEEMGGPGGATNPEQLFAAGWASCFHSALKAVAAQRKTRVTDSAVVAEVQVHATPEGGFTLAAALHVELSGVDQTTADELVEAAHAICPYSNLLGRTLGIGVSRAKSGTDEAALVTDAGYTVADASAEEKEPRGATQLRWFTDPAGYRVEPAGGARRHRPGAPRAGRPRLRELRELYESVLEFYLTDYRAPGLFFFRCNRAHHSIAPASAETASTHQLEFEHGSIDDAGRACDRAKVHDVPISISLGRHRNDRAISFYVRNPGGFHLEIGCGAIEVGDDWVPHDFGRPDEWGHHHADANPFAAPKP